MTLKELKNNILTSLYSLYEEGKSISVGLVDLCQLNKIVYDNINQVKQAGQSLKDLGMIKGYAMLNEFWCTQLTSQGIEFVEENLLSEDGRIVDSLKDTTKMMSMGDVEIDDSVSHGGFSSDFSSDFEHRKLNDNVNTDAASGGDNPQLYSISDIDYSIHDKDVASCFGVDLLADVFIKQVDKISSSSLESTPMIGILAPWGRGKSYFLDKVLCKLPRKRYCSVKFNAWKYQNTPALWAHLYATIYSTTNFFQKVMFWFDKYIWSKNFVLFVFVNVVISGALVILKPILYVNAETNIASYGFILQLLGGVISLLYTLFDNPVSAYRLIKKYFTNTDYSENLGIQNLIEKDLSRLLYWLSSRNKKVILCVDDIDRCSESKMLEVVDSLRTILENEKIAENLLIICCADVNKLKKAYKSKYSIYDQEGDSEELIREQLDKLFVFSLGLAPLNESQLMEYLEKLQAEEKIEREVESPSIIVDTSRQKGEVAPISGEDDLKVLEKADIIDILQKEIHKCNKILLTPRRLRITYYRMLFAVNLTSAQDTNLSRNILSAIADRSLSGKTEISEETALGDLIDMVVPY